MFNGQIHHIEYYVSDIERSREAWAPLLSHLGYKKFQTWEDGESYQCENGSYIVLAQVISNYKETTNNRQASGLNHLAFNVDDIEKLVSIVNSLGIGWSILKEDDNYLCIEDQDLICLEFISTPKE